MTSARAGWWRMAAPEIAAPGARVCNTKYRPGERGPRRWAGLLAGAVLLTACLGGPDGPTPVPSAVPVATALPLPALGVPATPQPMVVIGGQAFGVIAVPHFVIRYPAGDAVDVADLPVLVTRLEARYNALAALLGDPPPYTIPVQFEHDPNIGHATAGIVLYRHSGSLAYADQVTHALTHLFTGYTSYPFLEEGLAVYATMLLDGPDSWPLNGVAAGRQVAAAMGSPRYQPLANALRSPGLGPQEYSALVAQPGTQPLYLEAGAFAQFVITRYGLDAYRRLMAQPDPAAGAPVPGQVATLADLDAAFHAWLLSAAASVLPSPPPPAPAAAEPVAALGAPDAAALLATAVAHWQAARSVRFTISKLGHGEWAAPAYLHLYFLRPDNQQEVVVRDGTAYQHSGAAWLRLPAAQTPEATLAGAWQGIGAAASPAGPVQAATLDGRPVWAASYFLAETPDLDRYQIGGDTFIRLLFGVADGRVYRFRGAGYEERFSDWDVPVDIIQP